MAIVLAVSACSSTPPETTGAPAESVEFASLADIDPGYGAYELLVHSTGEEPRHVILRPPPVGMTATYQATVWHTDADGREQGVTAKIDLAVRVSAADGSATQLSLWLSEIEAWDAADRQNAALTADLAQLDGATATYWLDQSRVVTQNSQGPSLAGLGFGARTLGRELLVVPKLLALPLPTRALGPDAEWSGTTRSVDGAQTVFSGVAAVVSEEQFRLEIAVSLGTDAESTAAMSSGRLIVSGQSGSPFPELKQLELVDEDSGASAFIEMRLDQSDR